MSSDRHRQRGPGHLLPAACLSAFFAISMFPHVLHAESPLRKGDRIVFLGDSITEAGNAPGGYVALVREALGSKKKDLEIEVIGAGISGHRVPDLEKRLERDVLQKKPTIVVIYIGINDVWHSLQGRGTPREEFDQGLRRLVKRINDAGARVILCTPSVIGEKQDGSNQLDSMLEDYSSVSRKVAADTGSQLLDLRKAFLAHLREKNPRNAEREVLTGDGVHLNAAGNAFVASLVLEALGAAETGKKLLRHVVLFKFKTGTTPAQVDAIVEAFRALPGKIDTIVDFEWGTDVSTENRAEGFTHGFLVSFKDEKGREVYLPHPAHKEFIALAGPSIDRVLVFDYWSRN